MPGKPATDTPAFPHGRELLAELEALRGLLGRHGCPGEDAPDVLGLLRLCPGLRLDQWPELAARHGLQDWLALPLARAEFPFLARLQQVLNDLAFQTEHDPLTGLRNRRAFDRILARELERARRSGAALALAMFDLDDFKAVNDTYGHPCGDEVLTALARVLLEGTRSYDVAARLGGEEFALVMPETGLSKARGIVERILDAMRTRSVACPEAPPIRVTCSAGLACRRGPGDMSAQELYALADKALYEAKAQGKDRVVAAPLADLQPPRRESLVASNEKKFLFTGS